MELIKIEEQVKLILENLLEVNCDSLSSEDDLTELGLDSIKSIQLIVELEESFNITFDDEEMLFENFSIFGKIINIVSEKMVVYDPSSLI